MLEAGQRVVWSPRGAAEFRRYGVFKSKRWPDYVNLVFDGETDEKVFPASEVKAASLLETIAWVVNQAEEKDEAAKYGYDGGGAQEGAGGSS